jgi:uncharacterized protein
MDEPSEIVLDPSGAVGDRDFVVVDDEGAVVTATGLGALLRVGARYDPTAGLLSMRTPDGTVRDDVVQLGDVIEAVLHGHTPLPSREVVGSWAELLSRVGGRPLRLARPDAPGAACDVAPVTLLSQASLDELGRRSGLGEVDARRFRMLIHFSASTPHVEDTWTGRTLSIGEARLRVGGPVGRCAATTRHPERGDRDLPIVRAIRDYRGVVETVMGPGVPFGVYAEVLAGGRVRVGDRLELDE